MTPRTICMLLAGALLVPLALTAPAASEGGTSDLAIESFAVSRLYPPDAFILAVKVCNHGDATATGASVSWTMQALPGPLRLGAGNVKFLGTNAVPAIEPGKCADVKTFKGSATNLGEYEFTAGLNFDGDATPDDNRAVRQAAHPAALLGTGVGGFEI